jgi:hypothetical protein
MMYVPDSRKGQCFVVLDNLYVAALMTIKYYRWLSYSFIPSFRKKTLQNSQYILPKFIALLIIY